MFKVLLLLSISLVVMTAARRKHFVASKLFKHRANEEWKNIYGGLYGDWKE